MSRILFGSLFLFFICLLGFAADDLIILRNGDTIEGRVTKISDKEVSFEKASGKIHDKRINGDGIVSSTDVYMVRTKKRGTTFFTDRQRSIKETVMPEKNADLIFLLKGEVVIGWQVQLENGILSYQKEKEQLRAMSNVGAFPINEVFMVMYSDGSKDVFNEITVGTSSQNKSDKNDSDQQSQIKVVFHNVKSGETLGAIANMYGVTVKKIIEWNELSSRYTTSSKLKSGTQLMLEVKK